MTQHQDSETHRKKITPELTSWPTADILFARTHWIFDMDGTLTMAIHDFDQIRESLGLPMGEPILEAIAALEPGHAAEVTGKLDALEYEIAEEATQQPGATELLDYLLSTDRNIGILTRNGKGIAHATLQAAGLDHYFTSETIVSRDCCTAKPDPAGVELLMKRWNCQPTDTVMAGDYLYDLQSGFDAGVATIHMDVGSTFTWPDMTTLGVDSLPTLLTFLKQHT